MTLRTKIEEAIKAAKQNGDIRGHDWNYTVDQICTIFKEEIDQKFRKHRLPTNCSWAMAIKEQIQFDEEYGLYWDFTGSMENSLQRLLDWVEKEEYSWAGGNVVDSRSLIRKIKELKASPTFNLRKKNERR